MVLCGSRKLNKRRRLTQEILSTDHFTSPWYATARRRHYAGIGHLFQTESTKVNLRAGCAQEDTSLGKCSGFKLGHHEIQIRPQGDKVGQHPEANGNRLATPEPFLNSADADRMSGCQNRKYSPRVDVFRFTPQSGNRA